MLDTRTCPSAIRFPSKTNQSQPQPQPRYCNNLRIGIEGSLIGINKPTYSDLFKLYKPRLRRPLTPKNVISEHSQRPPRHSKGISAVSRPGSRL